MARPRQPHCPTDRHCPCQASIRSISVPCRRLVSNHRFDSKLSTAIMDFNSCSKKGSWLLMLTDFCVEVSDIPAQIVLSGRSNPTSGLIRSTTLTEARSSAVLCQVALPRPTRLFFLLIVWSTAPIPELLSLLWLP